jgi:hypothetical protein
LLTRNQGNRKADMKIVLELERDDKPGMDETRVAQEVVYA